jgi:hypothetical protein
MSLNGKKDGQQKTQQKEKRPSQKLSKRETEESANLLKQLASVYLL